METKDTTDAERNFWTHQVGVQISKYSNFQYIYLEYLSGEGVSSLLCVIRWCCLLTCLVYVNVTWAHQGVLEEVDYSDNER